MASISKVSGKSYRICTDAENDAYDELSFKTDAGDVSFTDGTDAETNLSAIKGITSDMSCEDESIAASAVAVKTLNDSLGGLRFGTDGDGNYGYYGADDSLIPFKSDLKLISSGGSWNNNSSHTVNLEIPITDAYIFASGHSGKVTCSIGTLIKNVQDGDSQESLAAYKYDGNEVNSVTFGNYGEHICWMVFQ